MNKRWTTEYFKQEVCKKYGDIFTYNKTVIKTNKDKVIVTCKKHDYDFIVVPHKFISRNYTCPKCKIEVKTKKFKERGIKKFGNKFNLDNVIFENYNIPVTIICKEHGEIKILPNNFLKNVYGCPSCTKDLRLNGKKTTEEFKIEAIKKHGNKFDYNKTIYVDCKTKVKIRCIKHDYTFEQKPLKHLSSKLCCPMCSRKIVKTTKTIKSDFRKVHGYMYNYGKVVYINKRIKVIITCKKHEKKKKKPCSHLRGSGCLKCS